MAEEVRIDHGEYYIGEDGQFRFRVVGANNEILAWGEAYMRKENCLATLEALCKGATNPIREGKADRSA